MRPLPFTQEIGLAELITSLPCVVYELTRDFAVRTISLNTTSLIGIQPDLLQGKRNLWDERLPPEDRCRVLARFAQILPGEMALEQHRIIDDQGLPVWVTHQFQKVGKSGDVSIRGFIAPIPKEGRAKSLDSGVISHFIHKIGNHFQLINLLIGALKRGSASTGEIESLQDTVDRAVEFTRSFSHYSQLPVYLNVDLGEVLRTAYQTMAPHFGEKSVACHLVGQESLQGAALNGDPFLLELALNAVIQNALDATPSSGEVVLSADRQSSGRHARSIAKICVADSGSGMGAEILTKAATPFFSSKPDRNGIGLSMAIRIFENHGGLLNISSQHGCGTRVEILLPLTEARAQIEDSL
jgi:signal transduction histidine kinase